MIAWFHDPKRKIQFRYVGVFFALVLVWQMSVQNVSLTSLAVSAYQNLAAISSMSATIPPNPYNSLALQFDQKQQELTTREQQLAEREAALNAKVEEASAANRMLTITVLGGVTILLLILILLNFYFDVKREEGRRNATTDNHHNEFSTKL